ncbi:MAG: AraC family transcriptional regulator [Deltaproteobacteria bacterium]|nr:AraC family transcriptional regulator [Deltaproteobacteria bacterium]
MRASANAKYSIDRITNGIDLLVVKKSSHSFPPHNHEDSYTLSLMVEGESYCFCGNDKEKIVKSKEVVLINPGQVHSGKPLNNMEISYITLFIKKKLISELFGTRTPVFNKVVISSHNLYKKITDISELILGNNHSVDDVKDFVKYIFSQNYIDFKEEKALEGQRIISAKDLLTSNLNTKISLTEISELLGINRSHFIRIFKKRTGLTPHAYRNQKRIEFAKDLLKQNKPIIDIAYKTGFSDQSHLNRRFKQFTGFTPNQLH